MLRKLHLEVLERKRNPEGKLKQTFFEKRGGKIGFSGMNCFGRALRKPRKI